MGQFLRSQGNLYILLVVEYASRWVEEIPTATNDAKVVLKFLRKNILTRQVVGDASCEVWNSP